MPRAPISGSPGPTSSRYFEDVYLARYLGYTLVEGGDLTVRNVGVASVNFSYVRV